MMMTKSMTKGEYVYLILAYRDIVAGEGIFIQLYRDLIEVHTSVNR